MEYTESRHNDSITKLNDFSRPNERRLRQSLWEMINPIAASTKLCEMRTKASAKYHAVKKVCVSKDDWKELLGITESYDYTKKVIGSIVNGQIEDIPYEEVHRVAVNWENGLPMRSASAAIGGFITGGIFGLGRLTYSNRDNLTRAVLPSVFKGAAGSGLTWLKGSTQVTVVDALICHFNSYNRTVLSNALSGVICGALLYKPRTFEEFVKNAIQAGAFGAFFGYREEAQHTRLVKDAGEHLEGS